MYASNKEPIRMFVKGRQNVEGEWTNLSIIFKLI